MLDYFKPKRVASRDGKGEEREKLDPATHKPVVDEDFEAFLERIVSEPEGPPPPLPERPGQVAIANSATVKDAQTVLMQGADITPLPNIPDTPEGEVATGIEGEHDIDHRGETSTDQSSGAKHKNRWSWLKRDEQAKKRKDQTDTADALAAASSGLKVPTTETGTDGQVSLGEAKKEEDEIVDVLDQLNLAAVNNRVFSISDESQNLLKSFSLVLKDLCTGVPTAFHDLESLLTNSDSQIQKLYKSLPPFLQELIEKLPERFTKGLGVEALAASAEKQGHKGQYFNKGVSAAEKMGIKFKVPGLKELLTKQGSIVALLRSIVAALRTRFPALLGMNVVWSLALFVLLFVFWYCHKRGRETRLEKERVVTEEEMAAIAARVASDPAWVPPPGWTQGQGQVMTRAPDGASVEEIRAGMLPQAEDVGDGAYAPDGSLAKAMREQEVEQVAGSKK